MGAQVGVEIKKNIADKQMFRLTMVRVAYLCLSQVILAISAVGLQTHASHGKLESNHIVPISTKDGTHLGDVHESLAQAAMCAHGKPRKSCYTCNSKKADGTYGR